MRHPLLAKAPNHLQGEIGAFLAEWNEAAHAERIYLLALLVDYTSLAPWVSATFAHIRYANALPVSGLLSANDLSSNTPTTIPPRRTKVSLGRLGGIS